jgi:hypothetical protein
VLGAITQKLLEMLLESGVKNLKTVKLFRYHAVGDKSK